MVTICHYAAKATGAAIIAAAAMASAATAQADIIGDFKTPSGDVYCQLATIGDTGSVVCEGGGPFHQPVPANCHGAWGGRFSITQGQPPVSECHTDTIRSNQPMAPILWFGQTQSVGTITCDSELSGVTCTDSSTGRFFTMAAAANTLG